MKKDDQKKARRTDNQVIIITGAPAVGKSTIAQTLRERFPRGIFIDIDDFRKFVGKVDMNSHDQDYLDTLKVVANNVRFLLNSELFLPVFIFDCLTPKRLDWFTEEIGDKSIVKKVVLWMSNKHLRDRMSLRKDHFYTDIENSLKINDWFLELKEQQSTNLIFLDRGELNVDQTVARIMEAIAG